ncbi:MAG: winged helix-turn-helix domain-containing protein [Alphaproteobacteria bacterium]|nr:MAG: winged helix-turn-helix domain-containing protein [Alphaproteobacteria bacterium]
MATLTLTNRQARALILNKQGLARPRRRKLSQDDLHDLIHQMGYVQIDTINTVERAHHMILFSRSECYEREQLHRLHAEERRLFEHWTHDACYIPAEFYPYWKSRFERAEKSLHKASWKKRLGPEPHKVIKQTLSRIRKEGPLKSRDFDDEKHLKEAWWGWGPSKTALEYLWRTGALAVSHRDNFQKVYDLAERVIPEDCQCRGLSDAEILDWKCRAALARLGIGTSGEIARFWDTVTSPEAAKWIKANEKDLIEVEIIGADKERRKAVALATLEDDLAALKEAPKPLRFLSPFDPVIRDRTRLERLFGFDYRIEIFVPEEQRQYGYYVLPILEGDRFTGRADIKVHRKDGLLELKGLWWEDGVRPTPAREDALRKELAKLAKFTGAEEIKADKAFRAATR